MLKVAEAMVATRRDADCLRDVIAKIEPMFREELHERVSEILET